MKPPTPLSHGAQDSRPLCLPACASHGKREGSDPRHGLHFSRKAQLATLRSRPPAGDRRRALTGALQEAGRAVYAPSESRFRDALVGEISASLRKTQMIRSRTGSFAGLKNRRRVVLPPRHGADCVAAVVGKSQEATAPTHHASPERGLVLGQPVGRVIHLGLTPWRTPNSSRTAAWTQWLSPTRSQPSTRTTHQSRMKS
jgi:hypothetical protein